MAHPIIQYALPALILGGTLGYWAAPVGAAMRPLGAQEVQQEKAMTPRARFLSSTEDAVDYNKLAQVCLAASQRESESMTRSSHSNLKNLNNFNVADAKELNPAEHELLKEGLDDMMSISLENGVWSSGAGMRARGILRRLPPADVADFQSLLATTLRRGDMQVEPGAWTPEI
jgi:hypothetical protein